MGLLFGYDNSNRKAILFSPLNYVFVRRSKGFKGNAGEANP